MKGGTPFSKIYANRSLYIYGKGLLDNIFVSETTSLCLTHCCTLKIDYGPVAERVSPASSGSDFEPLAPCSDVVQ